MKTKHLFFLTIIALLFAGCSSPTEEEQPTIYNLVLEHPTVTVSEGGTASVSIVSGNGNFQATSSNAAVATATIAQNRVQIAAVAHGTATITITDGRRR